MRRIWAALASLRLLWLVLALTGVVGWLEYRQSQKGHLQPRAHPRGHPQLAGRPLQELAEVLLALEPEGAEPHFLMGKALAERGKLKEARAHFEKALAVERRNLNLLFMYARLLMDLGEEPDRVKAVVDEIRRYYPRSRQEVEEYFSRASKGEIRFEQGY